jgi:hypothetical protein
MTKVVESHAMKFANDNLRAACARNRPTPSAWSGSGFAMTLR